MLNQKGRGKIEVRSAIAQQFGQIADMHHCRHKISYKDKSKTTYSALKPRSCQVTRTIFPCPFRPRRREPPCLHIDAAFPILENPISKGMKVAAVAREIPWSDYECELSGLSLHLGNDCIEM